MVDASNESGTIATHLSSCHWPSRDATSDECSANQQLDNPAQFYSWPVQQQLICALYKWSGTIVFIQYQWRAIAKSISMPCYLSLTQRDLNCFPKSQMNCRCFLEISNIFSSGVSISNRRISMMRLFLCNYMTDWRKFHIYTFWTKFACCYKSLYIEIPIWSEWSLSVETVFTPSPTSLLDLLRVVRQWQIKHPAGPRLH